MSQPDMSPSSSSWRYLASASNRLSLSSVKGFLKDSSTRLAAPLSRPTNAVGATDDEGQTWRAWAAQKIRGRGRYNQGNTRNEILTLFPGWAVRRYRDEGRPRLGLDNEQVPFEVEVFVSGYAISCRPMEQASRSQRAFIRFAKSFASLPRLADHSSPSVTPSTEELLNCPPTSNQVSDEFQAKVLDQQLQRAKYGDSDSDSETSNLFPSPSPSPSPPLSRSQCPSPILPPKEINTPADVLQKLHYNLESRLQLFWSSTLPSRTVRLHLFASPHNYTNSPRDPDTDESEHRPLATQDVTTGVDGSFNARLRINWEDLCQHPKALHIAFGEPMQEHDLVIVAELLPPPLIGPSASTPSSPHLTSHPSQASCDTLSSSSSPYFIPSYAPSSRLPRSHSQSHLHSHFSSHPHLHTLLTSLTSLTSSLISILTPASTASSHLRVPITHSPIRVISDIDDTVKMSGVTEGARAVFHNVFVKELKDGVIPGMGEWYSSMWQRGVRFHYVSNGPYEYVSLLREFFELSKLPPGSIKLKSYAGRSLLSGLLSTPATRKRAGVVDILDSFPDSSFILIGDSGEQDLELYADLARERPKQILAVFIRDAEEQCYPPIDDPTGWKRAGVGRTGEGPLLEYSPMSTTSSPSTSSPSIPPSVPFSTAGPGTDIGGIGGRKHATLTPGRMKRTLSDTTHTNVSSHTRPVVDTNMHTNGMGVFTNRPLTEEPPRDEFNDTPKQQKFPSLPSFTSTASTLKPSERYITTPPPPVPPLCIPSSSSFTMTEENVKGSTTDLDSHIPAEYGHGRGHRHSESRSSTRSTSSTSSSSSASFYKSSDPYSRFGSLSSFSPFSGRRNTGSSYGNSVSGVGGSGGSGGSSGSGSSGASGGSWKTENEKRRVELQMRVNRARTQMPGHVPLRVFRRPEECAEEVEEILRR